ncbi:DUF4230 domain-containing protein [Paludicola sp. MB14-C6]|uniref:DUF4230 domain-containing protein n=1 Tax=Paludihabitans sp. MB14-C6 TaxID=3070656 RepID=UPI0027DD7A86|nr:DUF4230 domain-containing protein [Paludicola sp. MB14-C6]WMJ22885.1 DUF4230 domain-containing protein [Paludicola sp. MB14-C6]
MEKNKLLNYFKGLKRRDKIICVVIVLAVLTGCVLGLKFTMFQNESGKVTTISKSSLEKVIGIEDLSTLEYTYNAVAKVYTDSDQGKRDEKNLKYSVAYKGKVSAGINFNKIKIDVNERNKIVIVTLPNVEIQDVTVDAGTMDYIFTKDKYDTDNIVQEAYKASLSDLNKRVDQKTNLHIIAKENAIQSVKGLLSSWIKSVDNEYVVDVK